MSTITLDQAFSIIDTYYTYQANLILTIPQDLGETLKQILKIVILRSYSLELQDKYNLIIYRFEIKTTNRNLPLEFKLLFDEFKSFNPFISQSVTHIERSYVNSQLNIKFYNYFSPLYNLYSIDRKLYDFLFNGI